MSNISPRQEGSAREENNKFSIRDKLSRIAKDTFSDCPIHPEGSGREEEERERWLDRNEKGNLIFCKTPKKINYDDPSSPGFEQDKISVVGAYHTATIFLVSVWHREDEKLSKQEKLSTDPQDTFSEFDYFAMFCSYLTGTPYSINAWRCSYLKITGRELTNPTAELLLNFYPFLDQEKMSLDVAFKTMQDLVVCYHNYYSYGFPQLVALIDSMIKNPSQHASEWELWNQALERARHGEEMGYE